MTLCIIRTILSKFMFQDCDIRRKPFQSRLVVVFLATRIIRDTHYTRVLSGLTFVCRHSVIAPQVQLRRAGRYAIAWIHCVRRTRLSRFVMLPRDPVRYVPHALRFQRSGKLVARSGSHRSRGEKLGQTPGAWSGSGISGVTSGKNPLYGKWICGPGSV